MDITVTASETARGLLQDLTCTTDKPNVNFRGLLRHPASEDSHPPQKVCQCFEDQNEHLPEPLRSSRGKYHWQLTLSHFNDCREECAA
jgi:hypothetical protein